MDAHPYRWSGLSGCRVAGLFLVIAGLLPRVAAARVAAGSGCRVAGGPRPNLIPLLHPFSTFCESSSSYTREPTPPSIFYSPPPHPSILPLKVLYIWAFIKSGYMIIYVAKNAAPTSKKWPQPWPWPLIFVRHYVRVWFTSCTVVGFWLTRKRTCRRDKNDHRRLGLRAQGWDLRRGRSEVSPSECRTSSGVHALHHSRRYMHNSAMLGPCDGTILGLLPCFWCRFFFAVFHTILRYSIQLINTEVRSHQDQRQEAKGEKRREKNIILKCGPSRKTRRLDKIREIRYILSYRRLDKERNTTRCRDNRRTRNRRTVECVGSMSSLLGVWW